MVARLFGPPDTLENLEDVLADQARGQEDRRIHSDRVLATRDGSLRVGGRVFRLRPEALKQLATRLRVPASYLTRCPSELAATNLNQWLRRLDRELLVRIDGGEVRAVLSARYRPISHLELVRAATRGLSRHTPVRYELGPRHFAAQILSHDALSGGDLHGGVHLGNSETGHRVVELQALVYRVVCLNGLILTDAAATLQRRHTRAPEATLDEAYRMAGEAWQVAERSRDRFHAVRSVRVPGPKLALERIADRYQLGPEIREALLRAFDLEPGASLFEVINAVTRAGNDGRLPLPDRMELQQLGGKILDLAAKGKRWL